MSAKSNHGEYTAENGGYQSWFANGLHRFIIIFSIAWFGIVAIYVTAFYGWKTLFTMLPNEFSGFMAGITLPLAIMWVIMAYIDRGAAFKNETRMLRDSLNQVIFPETNGTDASRMIAEAIKSQVADLKDATKDVCAQSELIKRDLSERVADLRELATSLDKYSSHSMLELNSEVQKLIDNFKVVADKASSTTADFRVNTMQMREDSEKLVNLLNPMVNEMVTAAERVKEVVNVNNENIAKAQEQLTQYSDSSQGAIGKMITSLTEKGENLEKTFLRTAENCEELFRRLDSGISHIESSVNEHKAVVEAQADLISKNSGYLDNKLGEYGRLISMEVEAMVERSGTLEQNIEAQLKNLKDTSEEVLRVFDGLDTNIASKRQLLENESRQVVENLNGSMNNINQEVSAALETYAGKVAGLSKVMEDHLDNLRDGYEKTEKQIDELNEKIQTNNIDTFMRGSSDIISELEALSVDIDAVFDKADKENDLWKKYHEGDREVFARYVSKNMTKKQLADIRKKYESKTTFRLLVDRYLQDFESLVNAARSNQRSGTFLALISGSDIGKVYYILARALDKVSI